MFTRSLKYCRKHKKLTNYMQRWKCNLNMKSCLMTALAMKCLNAKQSFFHGKNVWLKRFSKQKKSFDDNILANCICAIHINEIRCLFSYPSTFVVKQYSDDVIFTFHLMFTSKHKQNIIVTKYKFLFMNDTLVVFMQHDMSVIA